MNAANKRQKLNPGSQGTPATAVVNSSNSSATGDGANVAETPNVISEGRASPRREVKAAKRRQSRRSKHRTGRTAAV